MLLVCGRFVARRCPLGCPSAVPFCGCTAGSLGRPQCRSFFCGLALRIIWNVLFARACELIVTEPHTMSRFRGCLAVTDDLPSCVAVRSLKVDV